MRSNGRPIVPAILLALVLTLPTGAWATHNSAGAHVNVVEADEFVKRGPAAGELAPDVPANLSPLFHTDLATPRPAPGDQSGLRYTPSDGCQPASAFDDETVYKKALRNGTACYVGFLDGQWEYMQFLQIFGVRANTDRTYRLNPHPTDGPCHGEDPPERTGAEQVDRVASRANRTLSDPSCSGDGHQQFLPGFLMVDTDLLEAPVQGSDALSSPGAADVAGSEQASGTNVLPLMLTPYVFLFGQPHPDNLDPSPHIAGDGVFGPDPLEQGGPLNDLSDACGNRTEVCHLLEPADLIAYDQHASNLAAAGVPEVGQTARVCQFTPAFVYEHPPADRRTSTLCGPIGRTVDKFYGNLSYGGLGSEATPDTWVQTLPGWYRGAVFTTAGEAGALAHLADEYARDPVPSSVEDHPFLVDFELPLTDDTDGNATPPVWQVWAVNPKVPLQGDALWCVRPNLLAEGTGAGSIDAENDTGVWGPYLADAVDLDRFDPATGPSHQTTLDATHPTLAPAIALAQDTLPATGQGSDGQVPLLPPAAGQALATALEETRATATYGPDADATNRTFNKTRPAGPSCTADGRLTVEANDTTLDGRLRIDARLQANTANDDQLPSFPQPPGVLLSDPTRDDASPDDPAGWWSDLYSFDGRIQAVVDVNTNDRFDPCTLAATSTPDACVWEALWDAYNDECKDAQGTTCGELLDQAGYNTTEGVGLYAVLELTGPTLVVDEDRSSPSAIEHRTHLLGEDAPLSRNCVVATSTGFAPKLAVRLGLGKPAELPEHLCGDANGDRVLIRDAFDDQTALGKQLTGATERGIFSAAIQWARALPAPNATASAASLASQDALCLSAVFPVQANTTAADTNGNLNLTGDNVFTDCDPLHG